MLVPKEKLFGSEELVKSKGIGYISESLKIETVWKQGDDVSSLTNSSELIGLLGRC